MLRRKVMPPDLAEDWQAFQAQAERMEQARRALLGCLPVGRVDPAPVPVGLELLRDELVDIRAELGDWRRDEVQEHWQRCAAAVDEALEAIAHALGVVEGTDELLDVVEAVAEIVDPLDAWLDAERHWLRLRRRG